MYFQTSSDYYSKKSGCSDSLSKAVVVEYFHGASMVADRLVKSGAFVTALPMMVGKLEVVPSRHTLRALLVTFLCWPLL